MFAIGPYFSCDDSLMPISPTVCEVGVFTLDCVNAILDKWPEARYISIEPAQQNYATLLKALANAPTVSARVEPHCLALADHDGETALYDLGHEQLFSTFPRHMTEGLKLHGTERVKALTLRSMLDVCKVQTCDLLLLNCEGCEILALEELTRDSELRTRIRQISTSNHCRHVHIYPQGAWDAIIRALREWYDVTSREPVPNIEYFLFTRKGN